LPHWKNDNLSRWLQTLAGKRADPFIGIVGSQRVKTTEKKDPEDSIEVKEIRIRKDIYWLISLSDTEYAFAICL
jgi:hypothetical protein